MDAGVDQPVVEDAGSRDLDASPADSASPPPPMMDPNALTYARDVLPIMETYCTECHHEGRMPDLTALPADVGLRELIADRILERAATNMPPSPRDRLSAAELAVIQRWKAGGLW